MRKIKKTAVAGVLAGMLLVPVVATSAAAATVSGYRSCSSGTVVSLATARGQVVHAHSSGGVTKSVTITPPNNNLYNSTYDANFAAAGWAVGGTGLTVGGSACG
ncbi:MULTISPECIES: hypothetical protein [Cellulomonas]|uniref:hypothetical protein n=1 Tax=Cellulomonas TaxID=1707 RepID=UPI000B3C6984|nr:MULTISPECIES: hypothetical protein [Cellulomonas]MBO9556717.1 hypothetical protein [Cellulomonas sp.]